MIMLRFYELEDGWMICSQYMGSHASVGILCLQLLLGFTYGCIAPKDLVLYDVNFCYMMMIYDRG